MDGLPSNIPAHQLVDDNSCTNELDSDLEEETISRDEEFQSQELRVEGELLGNVFDGHARDFAALNGDNSTRVEPTLSLRHSGRSLISRKDRDIPTNSPSQKLPLVDRQTTTRPLSLP